LWLGAEKSIHAAETFFHSLQDIFKTIHYRPGKCWSYGVRIVFSPLKTARIFYSDKPPEIAGLGKCNKAKKDIKLLISFFV